MTNNKRCFNQRWLLAAISGVFLICALCVSRPAQADVPPWLRDAAQQASAASSAAGEANAVILYDEQANEVKENGEVEVTYRRAYLILRPDGRKEGTLVVPFDSQTKITSIRGWCLPKTGKEYEVKDKDAAETGLGEDFYSDLRHKVLEIPAAVPGNVVGYEYRQKSRPYILQDEWWFQSDLPVRLSRFTVNLPPNWKFRAYWMNYPKQSPKSESSSEIEWEVENIPAIHEEQDMPAWRAVAGRMGVTYTPPEGFAALGPVDWPEIGKWYDGLSANAIQSTPEISAKGKELTASSTTWVEKARAVTAFVQSQVRYVAIEIGIGGYQPHSAADIYKHKYGDCKDKATLLRVMLHEVGIESYYALAQVDRGVVNPDFASAISFNHAIVGIRVPDGQTVDTLSLVDDPKLGKLVFFDPTSSYTPFGYLPAELQDNYVLVSTPQGGQLVHLPLGPPSSNRILRTAKLELSPDGTLQGSVDETRFGDEAETERELFLASAGADRQKVIEDFLASFLGGFKLTKATSTTLDDVSPTFGLHYEFTADHYAKTVGNLLIIRPRVLGQKSSWVSEDGTRKFPIAFDDTSIQTDDFEISLPPGYVVDDTPDPVKVDAGFATYASDIQVTPGKIHYKRTYQVNQVLVPADKIGALNKFNRQVAGDENSSVVLKKQ
jgi:hypothetical protein